jgi:hypothetical protein
MVGRFAFVCVDDFSENCTKYITGATKANSLPGKSGYLQKLNFCLLVVLRTKNFILHLRSRISFVCPLSGLEIEYLEAPSDQHEWNNDCHFVSTRDSVN